MALSPNVSNMIPSGVSGWQITNLSKPDVAYYALPLRGQGKINITSVQTLDNLRRYRVPSRKLLAVAQFYALKTHANFTDLLAAMLTNRTGHIISTAGGNVISSNPTAGTIPPGGDFGLTWKLMSDKDMDDYMYVELSASRLLLHAEHDNITNPTNKPASGLATATDTFYNLTLATLSDYMPAGAATISLDTSPNTTWPDVVQNFRNVKFTMEALPMKGDQFGRISSRTIQFSLTTEPLECNYTEYVKWSSILQRLNSVKISFAGGATLTLTTQMGVTVEMVDEKELEDYSYIKLAMQGAIAVANFSGLWS